MSDGQCQVSFNGNLCPPLDIPLAISGNFGELRSNTFHAGIDFKTSALVGLNVIAVDDGYVSRIKVDLNGFGKALYIDHPNGTTSVYGHLEVFRDDIDKLCKREQYKLRQFGVDFTLKPGEIVIKRGEVIAFAGNRGGSSGPHMHFEIRDTKTQLTQNVFKVTNIAIPDTVPPILEKLWLFPIGNKSFINNKANAEDYEVTTTSGISQIRSPLVINASGNIGVGVQIYDQSSNSQNKIGIYSLELFVDDSLVFQQVLNRLSFDEMRYANSLIDYERYIKNGIRINRLFVQPNNHLSVYKFVKNQGLVNFADTATKSIKVKITDDFSNKNELTFVMKGKLASSNLKKQARPGILMHYQSENTFVYNGVKLFIPKDALYDDFLFEYSRIPQQPGYFSAVHSIHNPYTPLHKACSLSIKPMGLPSSLYTKALLISLDQAGHVVWNGGAFKDGFVTGNIRAFGNYTITIDTVPPQIQPLFTAIRNNDFTDWTGIAFTVKDNLSGISSYKGFIDGEWVLFEYDPKQDLLYHKFDSEHMLFGKHHRLELMVYDEKGNKTVYKQDFYK